MLHVVLLLLVCSLFGASAVAPGPNPGESDVLQNGRRLYMKQQVDHFDPYNKDTFQQKFFYNDSFWSGNKSQGPLLFVAGGEGPVNGITYMFVVGLAQKVGGLVIGSEHRYYGESLIEGSGRDRFRFLSVEQALADYESMIRFLTNKDGKFPCNDCPIAIFGGSYPGELAVYARLKYPGTFDMALGASAPIYYTSPSLVDKFAYFKAITDAMDHFSPGCSDSVRNAYSALMTSTSAEITAGIPLCEDLEHHLEWKGANTLDDFMALLYKIFADLSMHNYPPETSGFYAACDRMMGDTKDKGLAIFNRMLIPWRKEGSNCVSLAEYTPSGGNGTIHCGDLSGCGVSTQADAWDFQTCYQMVEAMATNNVTDMFPPYAWDMNWLDEHCKGRFGMLPSKTENMMKHQFGLDVFETVWPSLTSRIIMSNGMMDPWRVGGVMQSLSDSIIAITMENGAHHSDMHGPSEYDTADVIKARALETQTLTQWIEEVKLIKRGVTTTAEPKGSCHTHNHKKVSVLVFVISLVAVALSVAVITALIGNWRTQKTLSHAKDTPFQRLTEDAPEVGGDTFTE